MESELLNQGARLFITGNLKEAVKKFTELLNTHKDNYDAFLYRACAFIQLGEYSNALIDLEQAEKSCDKSFELYFKKGIANFGLENYENSSVDFKKALGLASNAEQREKLIIWNNKLDIELEEHGISNLSIIGQDSNQIQSNIKIIHSWYQNATQVTLSLESNTILNKENFESVIEKKLVKLVEKNSGNVIFEMTLSNSIVPTSSTAEFNGKRAEFKLKKEVEDFNWVTLDSSTVKDSQSTFKPTYPSSSKVKKDWDNLDKEIEKELNKEQAGGDEGMMKLFKQIYERGDEETRRAMMKSFQTSGGTVLSTNWGEVASKDYEGRDRPEPPKGQEWRKND